MKIVALCGLVILFGCTHLQAANSKSIQKWEEISVKSGSTAYRLNALFLNRPDFINPPLIVLTHGTPLDVSYTPKVLVEAMAKEAGEFLELGFAVLIVERRGFGRSKEKLIENKGDCDHRDELETGKSAASDILGAVDYAQTHLKINPKKIILAGHSTGGFLSIFASGYQHSGIVAIINIEGGNGFNGEIVCSKQSLLDAYRFAGTTSRVPTLWIYTENDHLFPPSLGKSMMKVFTSGGGQAEFFELPPFENEGHMLFGSPSGVPLWLPPIRSFLKKLNLCPNC